MTKKKNKSMIQRRLIPTYIFLAIVSLISVFPFYWMIMAATNNYVDVSKGKLTFGTYAAENFRNLISQQPLGLAMKNSFIYAISVTVILQVTDLRYIMINGKTDYSLFCFLQ